MNNVETGKIEGDYVVNGDFTLNGMITGTTTVMPGAAFNMNGTCCANLVVSQGGTAIVSGTISGDLINEGVVELRGVVKGNVVNRSAHFQKSPSAIIGGTIISA